MIPASKLENLISEIKDEKRKSIQLEKRKSIQPVVAEEVKPDAEVYVVLDDLTTKKTRGT